MISSDAAELNELLGRAEARYALLETLYLDEHERAERLLPAGVRLAYDGLEVVVDR